MLLALTIVLAVAVPVAFLYVIYWLDLYGQDGPRTVAMCFGWGCIAFLLSFAVNRFCIDVLGVPLRVVGTRTAPVVEEFFKAGVLVYLLRQGKLAYFVNGAIYGFASGIGFAAIENLRYIQRFPNNYFYVTVLRDFSTTIAHGAITALTGIALGALFLSPHRKHGFPPLIIGLAAAMTMHLAWNNFVFLSPLNQLTNESVLVGVALVGLGLVAAAILWGLRRERLLLRESLGMKLGVSEEEATVVQHMDDLDRLLAPIEQRFGRDKRRHVANFLHAEAQLGLKQGSVEKTTDPAMRAKLAADIAAAETKLDEERRNVGVYVMLYVRSIFPQTAWSLWARLAQALARPEARTVRASLWNALAARTATGATPEADGMYARVQSELVAREQAAALTMSHVHELPEAMRSCLHWVMKEVHVTAEHAAAGLGHHEVHVHAMLEELVARGFVHRTTADGKVAFRARPIGEESRAARPHIWQSLHRKIARHS